MKKSARTHCLWLWLTLGSLFAACLISGSFSARAAQNPKLPAPTIQQMMKNVVWNELQAAEHPSHYYRYIDRDVSPSGSQTFDRIATPHGYVGKLIAVGGHQPSRQQLQKNQQLLENLLGNKQLQQSRLNDQQKNSQRRDNVIRDVPNAFIFTYAGRDPQGIKLTFKPAPNFSPSSRQSLILKGMAGEVWVDPKTQRIVRIDGTLIQDVKIGWGFLATLNKGGRFLMEQSQASDGIWHQKLLFVRFDGSEFIIKHIHIHETEVSCCFKQVSSNLSIARAVHMLQSEKYEPEGWKSILDNIQKSAGSN